ncbi:hypothetical protein DIPPA_09743 [Diplonema papillatum]|nr:hypothetical protein DIPPA_09743 [Diplonema papillatum]
MAVGLMPSGEWPPSKELLAVVRRKEAAGERCEDLRRERQKKKNGLGAEMASLVLRREAALEAIRCTKARRKDRPEPDLAEADRKPIRTWDDVMIIGGGRLPPCKPTWAVVQKVERLFDCPYYVAIANSDVAVHVTRDDIRHAAPDEVEAARKLYQLRADPDGARAEFERQKTAVQRAIEASVLGLPVSSPTSQRRLAEVKEALRPEAARLVKDYDTVQAALAQLEADLLRLQEGTVYTTDRFSGGVPLSWGKGHALSSEPADALLERKAQVELVLDELNTRMHTVDAALTCLSLEIQE